ncbi:hypothetical protein [Mycolicibacterium sp.]|nr:hypothetical protein [Mycolicibacterium sp.]MBJ7341919.1 hypothetical protein [Mycolicibacterium sp.]
MDNTNSAQWAVSAANKFREVARTTENRTRNCSPRASHLAEAVRALDSK